MTLIPTPISILPEAPVSGDADFDEKADLFLPSLVLFSNELANLVADLNTKFSNLSTYVGTYITTSSFIIADDVSTWLIVGSRAQCNCGIDGVLYGTVSTVSYSAGTGKTTVTLSGVTLTSNLASILFFAGNSKTVPEHKSEHATGQRDAIAPIDIGAAPTSHASTATTYGAASETNYGHVQLGTATPTALGTAAKGTGTRAAHEDHVHPTTGLMLTTHAANSVTGFGTEPGAVSSSTSGTAGTATTVSRGDHSHDLGAHTHVDASTGGSLLSTTEPPAVSTSTSGAVGTATLLARADHGHDLGTHAHTGATVGGQLDHGAALTGLGDDDHPQYSLANGSRAFTATVSGVTPTADAHLATKAYVDSLAGATDAMIFKGVIDCSTSPNFPAADTGHTYKISIAGKIGGASGTNVEIGDMLICTTDGSVTGDLATVGANWSVIQTNIDGAVVGPASATSGRIATFSGTTGKIITDGAILATNIVRKDAASIIADSIKTYWGTGSDLALYHDGTNSYIDNITGSLYIRPVASETGILIAPNGAVTLYYDNAAKLATSSTGVTVTGTMAATTVTGANVTSGADPGHTHTAYVPKTLGTAKGDLIGFSASATASRVGVGTNGQVLTADSTAAAGVAWKEASGGFRQVFTSGNYTASSLDLVEVDTTTLASIVTLPASGMVEVYDAGGNCAVNNIIVKDSSANVLATLNVNYGDILFRYNTITSSWDAQNLSVNNGLVYPVTLSDESVPVVASKNYVGEAIAGQTVITPGFTWRTSWTGITLFIGGVKQAPGSYTVNSIGGGLSSQVTLSEALLGGETIDFTALDISSVPSLQGIVDKLALQSTQITNAGFGVWSNGTLESAVSSVNLITNGEEWTGASGSTPPTSWSQFGSPTQTLVAGNTGINALLITNNGSTQGGNSQAVTTIVGHVYKASCYIKAGTTYGALIAGTAVGTWDISYYNSMPTSWTRVEIVFEAVGTTTYISTINGPISGGTAYYDSITLYDMGTNLVTNGTFNSNTTGWTATNGTITSVVGGMNGNCLQLTNGTNVSGYASQVVAVTPGKLYRLTGGLKNGTAGGQWLYAGDSGLGDLGVFLGVNATWVTGSILIEAPASGLVRVVVVTQNSVTGNTALFDSITLTEVTVGCVDYNTKALDLWTKDLTAQCWRETIDTKEGSYYALRVYNGQVYWSDGNRAAKPEFYRKYAGRAAAEGMWVKCSTANKARIGITDSAGTTWSSYHSGGGSYEWLEVTRTPGAGITSYNIVLDSGTSTEAKFSQPQLQFGLSVGQGNFVPILGEYIPLENSIAISALHSKTFSSVSGVIKVTPDSMGTLPKGTKMAKILMHGYDLAAGGYGATLNDIKGNRQLGLWGMTAGVPVSETGDISLYEDSFAYVMAASGTNTYNVQYAMYKGVQL